MKLKYPHLPKTLGTIIQENYWSFYPSEPFRMLHFEMRYPVHKYQSHQGMEGTKAETCIWAKLLQRTLIQVQNPCLMKGSSKEKKVGQLYNFSAKVGWDKSQPFLYVPLGLSARQRAIHSNMRSYLASRDRVCDTVLNFHG